MADFAFRKGFESTFGKGMDIGSKAAQASIEERIKKNKESALKQAKLAQVQDMAFKQSELLKQNPGISDAAKSFALSQLDLIAESKDPDIASKILTSTSDLFQKEIMKSPLDEVIKQGKGVEAARTMGKPDLAAQIASVDISGQNKSNMQQQVQQPITTRVAPQPEGQSDLYSENNEFNLNLQPEVIDPRTGKPDPNVQAVNELKILQAKQELKGKVPTAKQKDDLQKIKDAESNIKQLEKDVDKLPSGIGGITANVLNFFTRGESNPDLLTYNDTRPAIAVGLYRALTGDTRLSDSDAASRALPLLWDSDEGKSVRKKKFDKLNQLIQERKKMISNGDYEVDENGQFITPISALSQKSISSELDLINKRLAELGGE